MIDLRWRGVRRVLAIRLDNLGDVLVTTPAIHAIRESLPDAEITLLASPVGAQVGRLNPDIDNVIVYEAPWVDPWNKLPQNPDHEQEMIARIRAQAFDGAIIFTSFRQSALPAAYLCYLAGIPLRVAASIDGPGSLLTTRHKHAEYPVGSIPHEVERGLDLVGAIGLTTQQRDLVLRVPDDARAAAIDLLESHGGEPNPEGASHLGELGGEVRHRAANCHPDEGGIFPVATTRQDPSTPLRSAQDDKTRKRLSQDDKGWWDGNRSRWSDHHDYRPLVVLHPGCSMPARTYPWEMFAEVADELIDRLGATVLLTGTESERSLVQQVRARMRHGDQVLDFAVGAPFPVFCGLVAQADLTITNNTGPMHVAAALKTPVVAVFALTNPPEQWGPWQVPHRQLYHDVSCRICYSRVCPYDHECLRLVTPAMVVNAAAELLAETREEGAGIALSRRNGANA